MTTKEVWTRDMHNAAEAVPAGWLVEFDGARYIAPERRDAGIVRLYHSLLTVGFANGWL